MKHTPFNKAVEDIKKMSMTAGEKQAMLTRITRSRPADILTEKQAVKSPWTVYSFSSWIQVHKLATVVAAILIIAISGNSIVLAANESLPGDVLYPVKVNVAEPIRVALAADPVKKAEIQTALVQTRFEEAETLASRGEFDDAKEQEISDLIDRHVTDVSKNMTEVEKSSPEKAEDANIAVQASMKAHARLLSKISADKFESVSKRSSSDTRRIAEKASKEADKFDRQLVVESRKPRQAKMFSVTVPVSVPALNIAATTTNEKDDSASTTIEIRKYDKEIEIYTKAKEKLDKQEKVQELHKSDDKTNNRSRNFNRNRQDSHREE